MKTRTAKSVFFSLLIPVFGCSSVVDPGASGSDTEDGTAAASDTRSEQTLGRAACGLSSAAFCETFDAPSSPAGRSGDLDEAIFGVARVTSKFNASQGELGAWAPGDAILCGAMTNGIVPGNDFRVCNGQLQESFNDSGDFAYHSTMIRQPFDFADRTGTIVFDVDAKAVQHGWWSELWVSDEPVAGPYQDSPGVATFPRNAFGIQLLGDWCPGAENAESSSVHELFVFKDYQLATDMTGGAFTARECFATKDQVLNHFEVRVSTKHLEVWGTDAGQSELRLIAAVDGLNLPFTRGYVHIQHTSYNAIKGHVAASQTFRWDNVGFDGPVLPAPRVYEVPDSLDVNSYGHTNVGYNLPAGGSLDFALKGVDTSGASSASVHLTVGNFDGSQPAKFRLNGGTWRDVVVHNPLNWQQGTVHLDVPLSEVVSGTNTLTFSNPNQSVMVVANADLTVE